MPWSRERPGGVVVGYAVLLVVATAADVLRVAVAPAHRRSGRRQSTARRPAGRGVPPRVRRDPARGGRDEPRRRGDVPAAGFTEIGRRPRYYAAGTDASIMRLPL
jgi:ribosomal-protein-alanine N-acetyltransferase